MEQLENFAQTYSQAPWRKQLQFIGLFALALVMAALVAGVYLNVSARAAAVGRDIQKMQTEITDMDRQIEDLQSRLAMVRSAEAMRARAEALGFELVQPEQLVYLSIRGFNERRPAVLAPPMDTRVAGARIMPPEYTESLAEWFRRTSVDAYVDVFARLLPLPAAGDQAGSGQP